MKEYITLFYIEDCKMSHYRPWDIWDIFLFHLPPRCAFVLDSRWADLTASLVRTGLWYEIKPSSGRLPRVLTPLAPAPSFSFNLTRQRKVVGIASFQSTGGRRWRDGPVRWRQLRHGEPPNPLEPQYFHSHVQIQDLLIERPADVSCYWWLGKNNQLTSTLLTAFVPSLQWLNSSYYENK